MPDTLRGPWLRSMPFFDQGQVVDLLDQLPGLDIWARAADDQVLMLPVRMCGLQERFVPAA